MVSRSNVFALCLAAAAISTPSHTAADEAERLTPAGAIAAALDANPTLRASLFTSVAARESAAAEGLSRVPILTATSSSQYGESLGGTSAGAIRTRSWSAGGRVGVSVSTDSGTALSLELNHTTQWRQAGLTPGVSTVVTVGPTHASSATVTLRQPLLRGRGREGVLAAMHRAEARADGAEADSLDATSTLVRDVLAAYYRLAGAERAAEVGVAAAGLGERQYEEARTRLGLGTLAPVDVLQFATSLANLREEARTSQTLRETRAVALAQLLGRAATPAVRAAAELPELAATPPIEPLRDRLRARSPRIRALEADVAAARAAYDAAANAARPRLDLTGSAGVAGLWMEDTYQGAALPGGRPGMIGNVSLELELPLVVRRADAQRAAANAELEAAEARLAAGVAAIEAALVTQLAQLEAARERARLAEETLVLARQLAEAERARLALGTTTPTAVLDAQQMERRSALRRDEATIEAAVALLEIEHAAGVLLERFRVATPEGIGR